jgi:hypothetical protein
VEDVAGFVHVEEDHGHVVALAQADGGPIHDLEATLQDFEGRPDVI